MKRLLFLFIVVLSASCSKYAKKVAGTYTGQMTINDSIVSSSANVVISEVSKKSISVESNFFNPSIVDIEKQRYFSSVTYYHQTSSGTNLEIGETATGLFLIFIHTDSLNNNYIFSGESN